MQQPASLSQIRSAAIGLAALALWPLWEAWVVFFSGSMADIHCNGVFSGTLCALGSSFGALVFGPNNAHLGYGFVIGALGFFLLLFAGRAYVKAKAP
jgi:hypothetical protein